MSAPRMTTEQKTNWIRFPKFLEQNRERIGRSAGYEALRANLIPHIRVNGIILVPEDAFDRMHEAQRSQEA